MDNIDLLKDDDVFLLSVCLDGETVTDFILYYMNVFNRKPQTTAKVS